MDKHRRKSPYNDPEVQGALARRVSLHWYLFTVVAAALAFGMQWMSDPFLPLSHHLLVACRTYGLFLLVLLCMTPAFVYDSVKLSNRFTGPMMRVRRATRSLADGENPGQIDLRGGDYWTGLAGDFNDMLNRLEQAEVVPKREVAPPQESDS